MSRNDDWMRPRPDGAGYRRDAVVAAVLTVAAFASTMLYAGAAAQDHAPWPVALGWSVLMAGSLAFRRRLPELVALVISVTFVVGQYSGITETLFANICLFLALYSVGAWGRNRMLATAVRIVIATGMGVWLIGVLIYQALNPGAQPTVSHEGVLSQFVSIGLITILTNLLYFGAAFVFGNASWNSARQREALIERTRELELQREVSGRQAVALERVRIARELHDVVAHHVSVMGLQAGAARRMLAKATPEGPADPRIRESLEAVESNARDAVDELHRMLGALREGDGDGNGERNRDGDDDVSEPAGAASTRGIAQLDELVASARAAGLPVEFSTVGQPLPVPPVIGLSVYRISQEALTNVRKHGGPRASADLRLRYLDSGIEVEISDTGVGSAASGRPPGPDGAGLGQVGMRERVAAVGGEIELGPKPRGGYRVRALLPLEPAARRCVDTPPTGAPA
ncbi:sensor histidine kinase [Herbiconiux sp.]|uniref:sensor histidine kinase n=1 Tax=Herbiconiux sp. TaxID=1871186 RepID=UPI0025C557C8|nr:sensor histidine kinase [Herbiconiux sp.]